MDVSRSTNISSKLKNNIVKFYNKFKKYEHTYQIENLNLED
jgi:hypothetical protein